MANRMLLKLWTPNNDLMRKYHIHVENHNNEMRNNPFYNSGFDLLQPEELKAKPGKQYKLNTQVRCAAFLLEDFTDDILRPTGFTMVPRSSLGSKTPLRMSNSIGIIDSGYRGDLMAFVDCLNYPDKFGDEFLIEKNSRLFQICSPNLGKIIVKIVSSESELGETARGTGGFGSTGN